MKITNIETILAGQRYLFVKVHTDTGLVGYGECGAWCYQEATAECIHAMEHHLIGLDPLNIEYINNGLTRCMHFRGSVVMAAISGIDIALWDLKGKYYNAPIYELLGGKVRDKARIYVNFKAKTPEDFAKTRIFCRSWILPSAIYSLPVKVRGGSTLHSCELWEVILFPGSCVVFWMRIRENRSTLLCTAIK